MIGDGRSSVSNSTSTTSDGGDDHEFPFGDDDHAEQHDEGSRDDISDDDDKGLTSFSATSAAFLHMSELELETPGGGILQEQNEEDADAVENSGGGGGSNSLDGAHNISTQSTSQEETLPSSPPVIIPHRGSLRRILNPSFLLDAKHPDHSNHSQLPNSAWPIYIINIATEDFQQHNQCYQVIFDRQQYEFCTRLFALLDTESESVVGPGCIREFVSLHCPVVRRRDNAIFALRSSDDCEINERNEGSPTFDEIWNNTIHSDPNVACTDGATYRIGIEGWMIFCRILALAHHQETQRRFASRHLQQMMRHKHGGGSNTGRSNEVVVMVENPPPGPPALISLCSLVEVEKGRMTSQPEQCIQGWPFCPLPLPELDLDLYLGYGTKFRGMTREPREPRGRVSIEQFSSAKDGDFILRWYKRGCTTVVRRSYSDFQWLNGILEYHKRPGQGHLCGRILPPLPSSQGGFLQQQLSKPSGVTQQPRDISERAIGVAKSGILFISSITKSVFSGLVTSSAPSSSPQTSLSRNTVTQVTTASSQADTLADVAQRIERYLNYLLEIDAFATSFPLNAVLKASQSGLESAKQILRDHTKHTKRQRSDLAAAINRDRSHSAASIFSALIHKTSTSIMRFQGDDDTRWLRAAAQVAMTLQFHGILETTGHESASAKIQHASLPKFGHQRAESWDDEETFHDRQQSSDGNSPRTETNFEVGVVTVESELVDDEQDLGGYDLLPSPGPSDEIRVLSAGVSNVQISGESSSMTFTYDATPEQSKGNYDKKDAVVGSVKVERDIDKLRDIVLSTKNTLDRLHRSSALIQSALSAKNGIQLCILRDVDSWADNGSEVITQRALVSGVASLEESSNDSEETNKAVTDDLLWQSLLASSAVDAVSEVREMVKASRTASRAKLAAYVAAEKSKANYESCDSTLPIERVRRAQLEASTTQSHAIHATVVEYEANVAKKRSAISFAHDVKSWNQHRKHELLRACIQAAKSQRDACRKAADAWESIRDGLVDFSTSTVAIDEVNPLPNLMDNSPVRLTPTKKQDMLDLDVLTSSYGFYVEETNKSSFDTGRVVQSQNEVGSEKQSPSEFVTDAFEEGLSYFNSLKGSEHSDTEGDVYCLSPAQFSHLNENYFSFQQEIVVKSDTESDDTETEAEQNHASFNNFDSASLPSPRDPMSTSMESLIDGLLTAWGDEDGNEVNEEELCTSSNDDSDILLGQRSIL